jgi:error-prone DNA polymerase
MKMSEHVVHDYAATSLSLKAHPVSFLRKKFLQLHILSAAELSKGVNGKLVKVAGLVLVRQRPGTAAGICFITLEDESGCANLVVFENIFNEYRKEILQSRLLMAEGTLQIEGEVIHVIVNRCYNLSKFLRDLTTSKDEEPPLLTLSRSDEKSIPPDVDKKVQALKKQQEKLFPDARNFR